jgi:hypothetical protein
LKGGRGKKKRKKKTRGILSIDDVVDQKEINIITSSNVY